ncbi:MAG: hypothetical protein HY330_00670, partial [Chloroflexi bacterium]|nr:hypothetical protein [Chloroflexota bacterium]
MSLTKPGRRLASLAALALVFAVACGGAAPTATPTTRPAATASAPVAAPTKAAPAQPTPTPAAAAQATAAPTRAAPTATARVAASRGKIVYAKPVDMGRSTTISAAGSAGGPDTPFSSSLNASFTARTLDNQLIPWLASGWKFSSDDKVLDVTIRKGAVFHDGSPVTADDVVYSLDKLWLNTIVPGAVPPSGSRPVLPSRVEKTGPDTVRVTFPEPDPTFLAELMNSEAPGGLINIYPKAVIERVGFDAFYKAPVASGPYKLAKRSPAESLVLEAHEQFFNGPPPVKTIEVRIAPEDTTRVAMFRTGEADIAESIAPQFLSDLERVPGAKVLTVRSGQEVVINIQTAVKTIPGTDRPNPFLDVRVRRALIHATDKKAIAERIAGRAGVPVVGPYSTFHLGAVPDKIQEYEYNPEKAKQLLKEA